MKSFIKWFLIAIFLLAFILVPFAFFGDPIEQWTVQHVIDDHSSKWWGSLILSGLLASDILLPVPSSLASTYCGVFLGFLPGTLASWSGMTISCILGFWLGRLGGRPLTRHFVGDKELSRLDHWEKRAGHWSIIATRPVPVLAEAAVVMAGAGDISFTRFMVLSCLANLGVSMVYAATGTFFSAGTNAFFMAFLFALVFPGCLMLISTMKERAAKQSNEGTANNESTEYCLHSN